MKIIEIPGVRKTNYSDHASIDLTELTFLTATGYLIT